MYREAVEQGANILKLAHQRNALHHQGEILNMLGLAVLQMNNAAQARSYFEQSLSVFRAQGNVRGVANALANLGMVAGGQGNYSTALTDYEESLRLMREVGSTKGEAPRLANLSWICGLLGDYQKAQMYAARSLQISREIGDRECEIYALINLSANAGAIGGSASAIDYARQAVKLSRESGDRNAQAWALTYEGHGLLESGMLGPARTIYREALDLRYQLDQPALAAEPAAGLARISLAQGDLLAAHSELEAVLAQIELDGTLEGTDQPLRVYLTCYLVLSRVGDPRANGILNTAHDMLKTRMNGISDPEAREAFLEKIAYNRELMSLWERRRRGERAASV
jgi:tetratricopeptide (TPR) repeat protein